MKQLFIVTILFSSICAYCQTDTSEVEQYCQVIATPRVLSNKVTIDIDYGEEKGFFTDDRLRTEEGKLNGNI